MFPDWLCSADFHPRVTDPRGWTSHCTRRILSLKSLPFSDWLCSADFHRRIALPLLPGPPRARRIVALRSLPFSGWLCFVISPVRLVRPLTARAHVDGRLDAGPPPSRALILSWRAFAKLNRCACRDAGFNDVATCELLHTFRPVT